MPTDELICPACSSHLKRPASLRQGELFECPMCATEFRVGGEGRITSRRPMRSRVDEVEEIDEGPVEELEVLDDGVRPGRRKKRKHRKSGAVELGNWIHLGFLHWMPMLLPSIGFCIIYVILYFLAALVFGLLSLIPVIGSFLTVFCLLSVVVSWSAGMTLVSVQQLRSWVYRRLTVGCPH
jgi:hypothetical protein